MLNLNQVTDLLSTVNPFSWLKTLYIWLGIFITGLLLGFYGGCEFKQNRWDASNLHALEKGAKNEKQDAITGAKTVGKLETTNQQIQNTSNFIKDQPKKPLVTIVQPTKCETQVVVSTNEGTKQSENSPTVFLTADFQRLYDLSVNPTDIGLRTRVYAEEHKVGIDEGFALIKRNNLQCAQDQARLDALIDRILQKKQNFKE